MIQNLMFDDDDENRGLKLTVSSDQLTKLNDSRIPPVENIKKVTSLNTNDLKPKNKNNTNHKQKAFNAKLNVYLSMKTKFQLAIHNLIKSHEQVIKSIPDNIIGTEVDDIYTEVKNTVKEQFNINFPKSIGEASKKNHKVFVSNIINQPLSLDIKTGHQKLDLAIYEVYEDVWKNCIDISETNMKYQFWLKMIIEPNNFGDLCDVREYLTENMINNEQTAEQIGAKLNTIYNNLQLKMINIINEFDEGLQYETHTIKQNSETIGNVNESEKLETNAEIKLQHAIVERQHKMDTKLKLLETENDKLSENSKQIKTLLGELSFRNRKLSNSKERIALLLKEKKDLISTIEKIEVKDGHFQMIQHQLAKEQEKNKRLRNIIENEYERRII